MDLARVNVVILDQQDPPIVLSMVFSMVSKVPVISIIDQGGDYSRNLMHFEMLTLHCFFWCVCPEITIV